MEKKNRSRGPNFTKHDSSLLCDIIHNYKHVIENKKTDGLTVNDKNKAWQEVTNLFNSSTTGSHRTLEALQNNYYKNLKKKLKKTSSDAKMNIPVQVLVHNIEEYGTSSEAWDTISHNLSTPVETCQEMLSDLKKEADRRDSLYKKKIMGTGGGPAPNIVQDPLLEKVKDLVGTTIDGLYTIYDGDSALMEHSKAEPVEAVNIDLQESQSEKSNYELFTNDRVNLKRKPHPSLVHVGKSTKKISSDVPGKKSVTEKFISLADEKLQLIAIQKELLQVQLIEEKEKNEHNRFLRAIEAEEAKKRQLALQEIPN